MQHTLPPPPPPRPPPGDTFYQDMVRRAARLVFYPFYRPFTDLSRTWSHALVAVVLRSLLMIGLLGIEFRLAQHALLTWALAHHQSTDPPVRPAGPFPLHAPLLDWQVVALVVVAVLLLVLDRQNPAWPIHFTWHRPFIERGRKAPVLILPTAEPDRLVLGRPYARTWDETENRMDEALLEQEVYTVSQAELCTHATVVAPTRAGKTYNVTIPLIEYIDRMEGAGIFIDAKGDDLTGARFDSEYPGAFHRRFHLGDWETSFRLHVWVGRTVRERAERLAAALIRDGVSEEGRYFSHNARVAFVNLVRAHAAVYEREPTFPELSTYLRNAERRAKLSQQLLAGELKDALARIDEVRSAKRDVLGGLDAILDPLAQPEIARFFASADDPGYTVEELIKAQARVCFTLPVGPYPEVAPLVGRMVISQFTQAVLDPANNTTSLKLLVVEDAANFVTPLLGLAMAQASSHQAAYVLVFQDLSQIRDEALIQDILTNSGLKIVLGGIGEADSARFSKVFGSRERLFRTQTASSGRGQGQNSSSGSQRGSDSSHRGRTESQQHNVGWGLAPRTRPDFTPTELRRLPAHHAVIERRDNRGHLTPAMLVHFDAELVRTLAQRQRQDRLGPHAEPLNHLHPFFPDRAAPTPAARASQPQPAAAEETERQRVGAGETTERTGERAGEQPATSAPPTQDTPPDATAESAAECPATTEGSVCAAQETPAGGLASASRAPVPPAPAVPGAPEPGRRTTPLPMLGDDLLTADQAPAEAHRPDAAPRPAMPVGTPPGTATSTEPDGQPIKASSGLLNTAAPGEAASAPTRVSPRPARGGRRAPKAASAGSGPVQPALPLLPRDPAEAPLPVPAQPAGVVSWVEGSDTRPLDPAGTADLLIRQLGVDAGSANFLATTAARRGYTQTSFAELLAQIQALPGSMNPYGVLFAQVASNLPLLDEEPDPVGELLIES